MICHIFSFLIQVVCKLILTARNVVAGLAAAAGLYYNGTHGTRSCFDIYTEYVHCADPTGCGLGPNAKAYDYQVHLKYIRYISSTQF